MVSAANLRRDRRSLEKNVEFATAVLAWRGAEPPSFERLDTTVAVQLMTV